MYIVKYEKVKTNDNFELDVEIRIPGVKPKKTVVMCHGLTSSKQCRRKQLFKLANRLWENDYKVIQFDFRGHGDSSGCDLDVSLSSFQKDLTTIIDKYINKDEEFYMFGFSNGALAINRYIYLTNDSRIKKVAFIGAPLDPINSSFLNPNTIFYKDTYEAMQNGSLEKNGYVELKSKNWRVSKKFLDECYNYDYNTAISYLENKAFLLHGKDDTRVDINFNREFAKKYNIRFKEYNANHSLFETLEDAMQDIVSYFDE